MRKKQEAIVMEEPEGVVEVTQETPEELKEEDVKEEDVKQDDVLNIPGVGSATAEKLISSGYDNLLSLAVTSPRELVQVAGVTEATARKMIQFSREKLDLGLNPVRTCLKKGKELRKSSAEAKRLILFLAEALKPGQLRKPLGHTEAPRLR